MSPKRSTSTRSCVSLARVEYSAYAYRKRLADLDITQSMKRPRELGDNAFIESFFGSMKADVIHGVTFEADDALRTAERTYIRRYNRTRLHSSLGYRSPIDFERASARASCMVCLLKRVKVPAARSASQRRVSGKSR